MEARAEDAVGSGDYFFGREQPWRRELVSVQEARG